MSELEIIGLRLIEKSIQAIKQSINDIKDSDLEISVVMYNTVLTGFQSL